MNKSIDYFEIKNIFIFLTIYFTVIPFLFNITMQSIYTIFVVFLGSLSYMYGYKTKNKIRVKNRILIKNRNTLLCLVGLLFLTNDLFHGIQNLFIIISIGDYTGNFTVTNFDSLYMQIIGIILYAVKFYVYALLLSKSKVLFYIVFISQILLVYNSPTRLVALSPFIIFIIYGYYFEYIKITKFRVIITFLSLPILFVTLLLARGKTEGLNYFQLLQNIFSSLTFEKFSSLLKMALESFRSFEDLTHIVVNGFVHIESGVIRMIFMPISRSIWGDKPESISRIISKEFNNGQYENGGGTVATIFGDAFINGHILGVLVILFSIGLASKIIYNTMKSNLNINKEQKSILVLFYAMFLYQFLFYFRGFFSEFFWKTIILLVVFSILYKIQFAIKPILLNNGKTI